MKPINLNRTRSSHCAQRGVGLIEILIAVVLLSIGFLAAAKMQVQGMRVSQSSYYTSQAYFMASDIIDRMRSNIKGVEDGEYNNIETASDAANPNCYTSICSPAGIAAQDLYDWSSLLHPLKQQIDTATNLPIGNFVSALPSSENIDARGEINTLASGLYQVKIYWSEIQGEDEVEQFLIVNFATEES